VKTQSNRNKDKQREIRSWYKWTGVKCKEVGSSPKQKGVGRMGAHKHAAAGGFRCTCKDIGVGNLGSQEWNQRKRLDGLHGPP